MDPSAKTPEYQAADYEMKLDQKHASNDYYQTAHQKDDKSLSAQIKDICPEIESSGRKVSYSFILLYASKLVICVLNRINLQLVMTAVLEKRRVLRPTKLKFHFLFEKIFSLKIADM